jgi:hypothetical protein
MKLISDWSVCNFLFLFCPGLTINFFAFFLMADGAHMRRSYESIFGCTLKRACDKALLFVIIGMKVWDNCLTRREPARHVCIESNFIFVTKA